MANMNPIIYFLGSSWRQSPLYVGDSSSATIGNLSDLDSATIGSILNVAFDINDEPFSSFTGEWAKVGLVDTGPSPGYNMLNQAQTLIAAVAMLDQLLVRNDSSKAPNALVHCASGGSRSVTSAALWMAQRIDFEDTFFPGSRFLNAINFVRMSRQLGYGSNVPDPSDPMKGYTAYNPTDPNANGVASPYPDGKPMAALFYLAQAIDDSQRLFPSKSRG